MDQIATLDDSKRRDLVFHRQLLIPGLTALLVSLISLLLVKYALGWGGLDLSIYLDGGRAFLQGSDVYQPPTPNTSHYVYPPITLLAFAPLSLLPMPVAFAIMAVACFLSLAGTIWVTLRWLGALVGQGLVGVVCGLMAVAVWLQPVLTPSIRVRSTSS